MYVIQEVDEPLAEVYSAGFATAEHGVHDGCVFCRIVVSTEEPCGMDHFRNEIEGKKELEKLKAENPDSTAIDHLLKLDRQTYLEDLKKI